MSLYETTPPSVEARLEALSKHPHFESLSMSRDGERYHVTIWCGGHHGINHSSGYSLLEALGRLLNALDVAVPHPLSACTGLGCKQYRSVGAK